MTKIALTITRLNKGGTARYLETLTRALEREGHEVRVFFGTTLKPEIEDEFALSPSATRVLSLQRKINPIRDIRAFLEIRSKLKKFGPEIVHSHTFKAGLLTRLVRLQARKIHTYHGHSFEDPEFGKLKKFLILQIERLVKELCNYYIVTGEYTGNSLQKLGILNAGNWISISPRVERPRTIDRCESRTKIGIPQETFLITWMGRFAPVKRPEMFIQLARELPQFRFLMSGSGHLNIGELPTNLSVTEWSPAESILGVSDLIVNTSASEGLSIAMIEAQLAGIPVLCFDVGSNSEVVLSGKTGYVVKSMEELKEKAIKLSSNAILRQELARNAARFAESKFTSEDFINKHLEIYQAIT